MKGRRGTHGAPTDLLVCFPSRAHLALMPPKGTCSPSRPSAAEPVKRRHSTSRVGLPAAHPLFKARNPSWRADVPVDDEPTSPKVTCVGQIKARPGRAAKPKGPGGKRKKPTWLEALGLRKEAVPFLNALHGAFRFNVAGCFGSFPGAVDYTSGEDEEDEIEGKEAEHDAALAKWFMVLEQGKKKQEQEQREVEEEAPPPNNALILMRCRSAPATGLPRRVGDEEQGQGKEESEEEVKSAKKREEEEKETLVLMSYAPDFFKVSVDIAEETWVVGGDDYFLRCRSWKR